MQERASADNGNVFPSLIRAARARAGLSQSELASLMGVSQPAVAQLEGGRKVILETTIAKVAGALGMSLLDLLAQEVPPMRRKLARERKKAAERRKEDPSCTRQPNPPTR